MKEKRYFCDSIFYVNKATNFQQWIIIILSLIVILPICTMIYYNLNISNYECALNSYSEDAYTELYQISNDVIQEGIGFNLYALPEDVEIYEITSNYNNVVFKYSLDNNKNVEHAISASMTVVLSKDYYVISKEPNYYSEEAYVNDIKNNLLTLSIFYGSITWMIIFIFLSICSLVAGIISENHKNRDLS